MPSSMALIRQAYADPTRRARAVAVWAMGASVASCSGPVLGGLLSLVSWRLIFGINLPVGAVALGLLAWTEPSPQRTVPFDWAGQISAVLAMGGLTYGAIEAGPGRPHRPPGDGRLRDSADRSGRVPRCPGARHAPDGPLELFRSRTVSAAVVIGFAFIVGYFGLPFVMSLYLQQLRGLSALATGLVFLP